MFTINTVGKSSRSAGLGGARNDENNAVNFEGGGEKKKDSAMRKRTYLRCPFINGRQRTHSFVRAPKDIYQIPPLQGDCHRAAISSPVLANPT